LPASADLRLSDQTVPHRAAPEDGVAVLAGARPVADVGDGAKGVFGPCHPRAPQGPGADAGADGAENGRVAGLPVADRGWQDLGVDRDAVPDLAGAGRQDG